MEVVLMTGRASERMAPGLPRYGNHSCLEGGRLLRFKKTRTFTVGT